MGAMLMYNYLTKDDNPFPMEHDVAPLNIVCMNAHAGAAFANIDKVWHVDFMVSHGDTLMKCHNIQNDVHNYSIIRANGKVTIW